MIQRDAKYYAAGFDVKDPEDAPFYKRSLVFDGKDGDFNTGLVDGFNRYLEDNSIFKGIGLDYKEAGPSLIPSQIVVVNASHDNLPTSYETARIFEGLCSEKGLNVKVQVVNTKDELFDAVNKGPGGTLVMSQCVDKYVYNVMIADELQKMGAVIVPGRFTAPGSVFSDKDSTYQLLSEGGKVWDKVARYRKVEEEGKTVEEVVDDIFEAVDELMTETGDNTFFVKPHEGGGGLGGFRISLTDNGYIVPDLSKVSGDVSEVHPLFLEIDVNNDDRLYEILWIYKLFAGDSMMKKNYIKVDLGIEGKSDAEAIQIIRKYLLDTEHKRHAKLEVLAKPKEETRERLVDAITTFEEKFDRRYTPLVNEHIDFGTWGLRAHYRLTINGPRLETIYHRVFQLGFTDEGIGYVGSDNISNKQTGELEITRLGPINEIMVKSIGGEAALNKTLLKGAEALVEVAGLLPDEERDKVPLRVQIDLAAISHRIGEGNADTARGLCLASRWPEFVKNAREWLEDSFMYYSWEKGPTA